MNATFTKDPDRPRARGASLRHRAGSRTVAYLLLLQLISGSLATSTFAQPTDPQIAEARRLFAQGKKAEEEGSWTEALDAFQKVGKVRMTPQVRFHIALADEKLGHLATALHGFEEAQSLAAADPDNAKDVLDNAPDHETQLRERAPKLHIEVTGHGEFRVLVDGAEWPSEQLGKDVPVDPGAHAVVLEITTAKGVTEAPPREITSRERATERVVLRVPEEKVAEALPLAPMKPPPNPGKRGNKLPAIVAGSVGIASLVVSGVFLGLRQSSIGKVRASCSDKENDRGCDPKLASVATNGKTDTILSSTFAVVGAAGLATGALLWFTVGKDKPAETATSISVGPSSVSVFGRF